MSAKRLRIDQQPLLWIGYFTGLLVFNLQASCLATLLQRSQFGSRESASIAALLPFGGVLRTIVMIDSTGPKISSRVMAIR